MKKILIGLAVGAVLVLAVVWGASAQGTQILLNEHAEDGNMLHWTYDANFAAVTSAGPWPGGTALPHWGNWFFSASEAPSTSSSMSQNVDVSGKYFYCAGGFIQTELYPDDVPATPVSNHDHGEMIITFFDGVTYLEHHATGAIGNPVDPMGGENYYERFEICAFIPPAADNADYQLNAHTIAPTHSNVYYDDLYFEVWELILDLQPETATNFVGEEHEVCLALAPDPLGGPVAGIPIWIEISGANNLDSGGQYSDESGVACFAYVGSTVGRDDIFAFVDWNQDGQWGGEEPGLEAVKYWEEPPEEFVPEWGSIALLGSGLMGLAGYATLRWRAKK
jgi:hypothetical protein